MLLQNYEQYEVVKSSGIGILQHDAFTWQIEDGKFVKAVDIEAKQKRMNEALNQWIFTLPEEERQLFVETLFQVIDQTGVTTLTEFSEHWKENLKSCLKSLKSLDPETGNESVELLKSCWRFTEIPCGEKRKMRSEKLIFHIDVNSAF